MEDLYDILQTIKNEPYRLGRRSIFNLEAFFLGYNHAMRNTQSPTYKKYRQEFSELIQWIRNKYDAGKSCAWSSVILFYSEDEKDALDNFFKLVDEFLNEKIEKDESDSKYLD
ncbi:hypothetical protein [Nostoc sp. 'Peltigera membranacea cyanobiont' 232]|uniref:hypothetical protein n=1 Tax=Nostoc sp. 'Peltigera membranacea cyanobiont' 232 TaxID=2014531 RepID=UPI000B951734|nr:hypothetical protein [Nostoc sp. 'Peltigera membranacea cyanobiont' 232]OYD99969.1 hypothetical protein CDG79_37810 [Nostoc sp. 'Peltigera membranacea cyanobiont' 232]